MSDIIIKKNNIWKEKKKLPTPWAIKSAVLEAPSLLLHFSDKVINYLWAHFAPCASVCWAPQNPKPSRNSAHSSSLWQGGALFVGLFADALFFLNLAWVVNTPVLKRAVKQRTEHKPVLVNSQGWLQAFTKYKILASSSSCWADKLSAVLTDRIPHLKEVRQKKLYNTSTRELMLLLEKGVWITRLCKI